MQTDSEPREKIKDQLVLLMVLKSIAKELL